MGKQDEGLEGPGEDLSGGSCSQNPNPVFWAFKGMTDRTGAWGVQSCAYLCMSLVPAVTQGEGKRGVCGGES